MQVVLLKVVGAVGMGGGIVCYKLEKEHHPLQAASHSVMRAISEDANAGQPCRAEGHLLGRAAELLCPG